MMLYKNTKTIVSSLDSNIDFFDIVVEVLQGDTITPYSFIICLDFIFIGQVGRMFANGPGDLGFISGRVIPKTLKMVLDISLLSTQQYISRVKWSNPGKGVAPSPTPLCSSY